MKKKFHPLLKLCLWIGLVWGLGLLLSALTPFPKLNEFVLVALGAGIFLLINRPLARVGGSQTVETGLIAVCGLVFILHLCWIFLVPRLANEELLSQPCSIKSLEIQCYTFNQQDCTSVWQHYSKDCNDQIKERMASSRRSTALTGPLVRRCIYKKLDQSFHSNRRTPMNDTCQRLFESLDAPFQD